jgi:hypothetical protein
MPLIQPDTNEQPSDYARRLTVEGLMPFEIIKAIRQKFHLELEFAVPLVATDMELTIFLDAQVRRGLSRSGAVRLACKVYGLTKGAAEAAVLQHGGFQGRVE